MKRILGILGLVVVGLALQNNYPSLQLLILWLPLCLVVALSYYQSPSNHVLAVVGVCLLYGSLSGMFAYSASVGLVGLMSVWLAARLRLPLAVIGVGVTVAAQIGFIIVGAEINPLVIASFVVQLIVILVVCLKLSGGTDRARV